MRLIDADALKDKARELIPDYHAAVVMNLFDLFDALADNTPTIEPKHGKLTHVGYDCGLKIYECSVCNKRCYGKMNYCPNCGAKVERSEE